VSTALNRIDAALVGRLVVAAGMFSIFAVTNSNFASSGSVYGILQSVAFTGMVALGLGITMVAGELDLSVGSVAAVAGVIAVKLAGIGLIPVLIVVLVGGALFGAIQGYLIARMRVNSLVFTVGTLIAVRGLAYIVSSNNSVPLDFTKLGLSDEIVKRYWVFSPFSFATIGAFVLVGLFLAFHRFGREIYAVGGGRAESRAAGVPQTRPIVIAFTFSAGLASLAGGIASIASGGASPFGFDSVLLTAVTAALIGGVSLYGGKGDVFGIFVGMLTLQFLLSGLSSRGTPYYVQNMATGGLLLGFLVLEYLTEGSRRWRGPSWAPGLATARTRAD
jgi:ribose/xylose/arabinose/galactoside ABC-type transport system permease subunit